MKVNTVLNVDCIEGLNGLDSNSIDLTVTSPPYDDLRKYNGYTFNYEKTAEELYRVTKPGGVVIWVVGDSTKNGSETGTSFRQALYFMGCGFKLYDTMIYRKQNFPPLSHKRYEQEFEYMFVFSKGKPKTFHPIMIPCKYAGSTTWGNSTFHKTNDSGLVDCGKKKINDYKRHGNIFTYLTGKEKSIEGKRHPAPFPLQLVIDQIQTWSNEGETVLDVFMGSGTTAVGAIQTQRNYLGFEISKEYCEMTEKRIRREYAERRKKTGCGATEESRRPEDT